MLHMQAKVYGLPPHLLAQGTWEELCFNQAVLEAGAEFERRNQAKAGSPGRGGQPGQHLRRAYRRKG